MKSTHYLVPTIGLVLSFGCFTSHAADWLDRMYVRTDVGPSFTQDTSARLRSLIPPPYGSSIFHSKVQFNAGVRGGVSVGYQITKPLAVELETGVIWDSVKTAPDLTYQIPLMANLLYQVPLGKSWKAYLGAGAGETFSHLQVLIWDESIHGLLREEGTSFAFTYQAQAGVHYSVSDHLDIGFGYKFTHVGENRWDARAPFGGPATVRVNGLYNHMVLLSATYKF